MIESDLPAGAARAAGRVGVSPGVWPAVWPYRRVFAHRCGGQLAPENTLAGLVVARRYGCGVEFDAMLSAERTPFLIHDETLERTTDGRGEVAATSDVQLAALDAGRWFSDDFAGEPLPSLRAALLRCAEWAIDVNVEIKPALGQDDATARVVAETVLQHWRSDRPPLLSSFSERAIEVARAVAPSLPRGLLVERVPPDWQAHCERLGVVALHVESSALDEATARAVRGAGLWLVVYTENDPGRAARLFDWGVDCVITDRPDLIP